MMTLEEKKQFSEILKTLGETLDITETQYNAAVRSYRAVGEHLAKPYTSLAPYKPVIRPQGSFMLGTMIKPVCEDDDIDIDLVCELTGKNPKWTQFNLKQAVGSRLKEHEVYKSMLEKEGRRCWTLKYADVSNYHLDILPSVVCDGYSTVLEKAFSHEELGGDYNSLAIRITDKEQDNYYTTTQPEYWMKSNPFGYGRWFFKEAEIAERRTVMLSESVNPVPTYNKEKLPLQRIVQILKRHRDIMFNGDEDKPISIIITTLASMAYKKETSIIEGLMNVATKMRENIEDRYDLRLDRIVKWVPNPVNPEENFADKWVEHPKREKNFYKWIDRVELDINTIIQQRGLHNISESMKKPFGEQAVNKTLSTFGERKRILRESGELKMAAGTGVLGVSGEVVTKPHHFHGYD